MKLAILAGALALAATAAFAQDTTVSAGPWVALIQPFVSEVADALIPLLVGSAVIYLRARWNIQIAAENRAAFQAAVTNAAGLLIQRAGSKAAAATLDVGSPMLKEAILYVERGAPDALKRQGITAEHVAEAIIAKIPQIDVRAAPLNLSAASVSP